MIIQYLKLKSVQVGQRSPCTLTSTKVALNGRTRAEGMTTEFLLMVKIEKPISHVQAVAQGKQAITGVVFHTYRNIITVVVEVEIKAITPKYSVRDIMRVVATQGGEVINTIYGGLTCGKGEGGPIGLGEIP